jgi:predicted HTH domain antitoxin
MPGIFIDQRVRIQSSISALAGISSPIAFLRSSSDNLKIVITIRAGACPGGAIMNMRFSISLPPHVEAGLRTESGDLPTAAREAFGIELFRRGILSHHELGQALDRDRVETDALLKRHNVTEHTLTHEDVDADVDCLRALVAPLPA